MKTTETRNKTRKRQKRTRKRDEKYSGRIVFQDLVVWVWGRVAILREKLFRGTRNRQKFWSFRRNSVCFVERKKLKNPFRTISSKRKTLGTSKFRSEPFPGRENARNSIPNHFVEEKTTQNFVILFSEPFRKRQKSSKFRAATFCRREKNSEFCSEPLS
jgi:hypothetical protein